MFSVGELLVYGIIFLSCFYYILVHRSKKRQFANQIGGPPGYPLIGNAYEFIKNFGRTLFTLSKWVDEYGGRFTFYFGPVLVFVINTAEDLEAVLTSTTLIQKSEEYDMEKDWLGEGLVTSTETAMGIKLNAQTGEGAGMEYVNAVHRMGGLFQYRSIRPWMRNNFLWKLSAKGREEMECLKIIHSFTDRVIRDRKSLLESVNVVDNEYDEEDISFRKIRLSLLDMLIKAQKIDNSISDAGIRDETGTFIFAGHDTVSVTASFCLFNIGNHPEIQEKLHREMDAIFQGDQSREITTADLREMKYLECCIKESLRLYPSVPIIGRQVTRDFRLDENTVIPAGVVLYMAPFTVHRNSKYFPRPLEFIPERFAVGSCMANRNAFAYIPFSAGPRNCVGQKLAMIEAKVLLATILRRFHIKSQQKPEELELLSEIILRTKDGLKLSLRER